ncbi:MAG TPA: hypothetical protein VFD00_01085 [Thermoclostridium sp.]|nr:hypothetical protein [Thermoclostridium sp.]
MKGGQNGTSPESFLCTSDTSQHGHVSGEIDIIFRRLGQMRRDWIFYYRAWSILDIGISS